MDNDTGLEGRLNEKRPPSNRKIITVDIGGNITYGLVVGALLDYSAGLNVAGILASRTYATAMNSVVGGPYGWWRERTFKATRTNENSGKIRRTLVDLLAFNTFQVPMYATAIAIGSLISEGRIDWEKVRDGATNLAMISPLIGPTMGWYLDGFRRLFGIKSAAEGAYKSNIVNPEE